MKKYIRSDYVEANLLTQLHNSSKEQLESVVSQIARIAKDDTVSSNNRLVKIKYLLSKYNLH